MFFIILALAVVLVDQLSKYYVVTHFALGESVPVVEQVFHLTYVLNSGAAFGIFEGSRWLFVLIAVSVIGCVLFLQEEIVRGGLFSIYGTVLFTGGAFGNLIDRVRQGLVIDFFDFRIWPVFNVADIAICVGVGLIIWSILRTEFVREQNSK